MFSDERRYVRRDDADNPFKDDVALWGYCANCGAPLLLPPDAAPFCGTTVSECREIPRRSN